MAALWQASQAGQTQLTLLDFEPDLPVLPLAVADTLSLIERVGEFYGCPLPLPEVRVLVLRPQAPEAYRQVLEKCALFNPAFPDAPRTRLTLEEHEQLFSLDGINHSFSTGHGAGLPGAWTPNKLEKLSGPFEGAVMASPVPKGAPVNVERQLLDFFARRFFAVPELRPEQAELIQRALRGKSGLGILPTGFGKSLVFQLYALLTPQTTLVISPLKALIRDQVYSMHRLGLSCVEAITGSDSSALKDRKLAEFRARKYRLLYISPERLQIKAFYEELRARRWRARRSGPSWWTKPTAFPSGATTSGRRTCKFRTFHQQLRQAQRPRHAHPGPDRHRLRTGAQRHLLGAGVISKTA